VIFLRVIFSARVSEKFRGRNSRWRGTSMHTGFARRATHARIGTQSATTAPRHAPTKSPTSTQHKKFVDASEQLQYLTHHTRVMFQLTDNQINFVTRNRGQKGGIINGDQESC
jgi:hypothetical protein